jgi:hypothetical protein
VLVGEGRVAGSLITSLGAGKTVWLGRLLITRRHWKVRSFGNKPDILCSFRAFPLSTQGDIDQQYKNAPQGLADPPSRAFVSSATMSSQLWRWG